MAQHSFPPLILASGSPRRRSLLKEHGYPFTVEAADIEEIAPSHLSPGEIVLYNARAKARSIALKRPGSLVLGADTLVAFGNQILGKPANMQAAEEMLRQLNGNIHAVYSGVWLSHWDARHEHGFVEVTSVRFHRLEDAALRAYLATIGPLDKAGAYAAQDDRGELIAEVQGSFSNVVGLPMERLGRVLQRWGEES